jgi:anaerobic selenocysteine-containing dehydrogenase
MIERGWFDREFVENWTNGPLLVRLDNGRLLRERDIAPGGSPNNYVAWDEARATPVVYDPARRAYAPNAATLALHGEMIVATPNGPVTCRTAFQLAADICRRNAPNAVEAICGVSAEQIERTARLLWEARPVAYYAWSGIEQHRDTTQIARAIAQLYALTGSFDARGGNVGFPAVPSKPIAGAELLPPSQREKSLGLPRRPLGPSRWEFVTSDDFYTAALDARPYRARGLVVFGSNLLLANADSARGREALRALDFYVHADLFLNPTAELADIVLPVASPFETEALAIGFEVSPDAQSLVQLRRPLVQPQGEARSDTRIIFDLAKRLGLGEHFWGGDVEAAYRYQLEPSGVSVEELRARPEGIRVELETRYRKFAETHEGAARGFDTPTRKVELYSETLLDHGYAPLPEFVSSEPSSALDAARYPLTLTCSKSTWFCESQHRALPSLRRRAREPEVEIHPDTARLRGIAAGEWVAIETRAGSVRARAKLNDALEPSVVCGQHGWWQACAEIGAPGYDPFGADSANLNLLIRHEPSDVTGGSVAHRACACNVARLESSPVRRLGS